MTVGDLACALDLPLLQHSAVQCILKGIAVSISCEERVNLVRAPAPSKGSDAACLRVEPQFGASPWGYCGGPVSGHVGAKVDHYGGRGVRAAFAPLHTTPPPLAQWGLNRDLEQGIC